MTLFHSRFNYMGIKYLSNFVMDINTFLIRDSRFSLIQATTLFKKLVKRMNRFIINKYIIGTRGKTFILLIKIIKCLFCL